MYTLGNNKPLIGKEQNYVLDRKLLTVHSEDRDITKWVNSNQFEITLPESILNVQSLRLVEVEMPANLYTFSDNYKNTQLSYKYDDVDRVITIGEGTYTPDELAAEIEFKMNETEENTELKVHYDKISQKFFFGTTKDDKEFQIMFKNITYNYDISCNNISSNDNVESHYTNWGLGSYLGFNKNKDYSGVAVGDEEFNKLVNDWINTAGNVITHYIEADFKQNIMCEKCIYMEVEKYNSMDELYPYTESSKDMYNHSGISGKVNSAFAKIPMNANYDKCLFTSRNDLLQNITHYEPPIERISKLKFAFRFHDGRYVDFQNNNFNFTLEFNSLKNEIGKNYNVRIPHTYLL